MRRTLCLLMALVCVLGMFPAAGLANEIMYVDTANHKSVNLREDMSTDSAILCSVPYGYAVTVTDMLYGSSWVAVEYNGNYGYIMARYLSYDPPVPTPTHTRRPTPTATRTPVIANIYDGFVPAYATVVVRPSTPGGFVNMRWAPSKQAPVFNIYYANSQLEVFYSNGIWSQVYDPASRTFGYMMTAFLEVVGYGGDGVGSDS